MEINAHQVEQSWMTHVEAHHALTDEGFEMEPRANDMVGYVHETGVFIRIHTGFPVLPRCHIQEAVDMARAYSLVSFCA